MGSKLTISPAGSGGFYCRPCNRRYDTGGRCDRCGSIRAAWYEPKRPSQKCPACNGVHTRASRDGSRICNDCHAEFEPVEVSFCDSRPDANAQKREEFEQRESARKRSGNRKNRD